MKDREKALKGKLNKVMDDYPPNPDEIRFLYNYTLELYPEVNMLSKLKPQDENIISGLWWDIGAIYEQKQTVEARLDRDLEDIENQKDAFANLLWLIYVLTTEHT